MDLELALQGLFLYLTQHGFPLGIRDYEDALKALQAGYGLADRQHLLWLCQTLWARTEEEHRVLDLLFRQFPFPTPKDVSDLTGTAEPEMATSQLDGPSSPLTPTGKDTQPPDIRFVPPSQGSLVLPKAHVYPVKDETFILTPQPLIPLRNLIVIWRRFRLPVRTGPKTELDLQATIEERCRRGVIETPVMISRRRNQARLVVLIDVSSSMIIWRTFSSGLVESLLESQLGEVTIFYFDNIPENIVYTQPTLLQPVSIERALQEHPDCALLIVSDGGAARGKNHMTRITATHDFVAQVKSTWQPIVWLNPVPQKRWTASSAHTISRLASVTMLPLSEDNLVNAVDILRGYKSK